MMKRILIFLALSLLASCSGEKAPLVGITCSRSASGATVLSPAYTGAVSKAGGVAMVLPTVGTRKEADALLKALDGVVFSGGEDVNPAWYGEEIWNETVEIDPVRDRSDSLLARAALDSGKPVLAICRGMQLMNVVMGGSLWQDIPSQVPETVGHGGGVVHKIGLETGSVLADIYGPDSLAVNSFHHQAVKDPAPGFRVTARSAEGLAEAAESNQVTGVQFHPEKMLRDGDERWLRLFQHFVNRCRE